MGPHDRRSIAELLAIVATGACHFVCESFLHQKALFIAVAAGGWGAYVAASVARDRTILRDWGFGLRGFGAASVGPALVLVVGAVLLGAIGRARGTFAVNAHLGILLAVYPLWGIVQQFLLQAMVARNLRRRIASPALVTWLAALLFGAVHLPDLVLAGATALLALCFVPLYLRQRSIVPLGIVHGWLGAFAYFWLLGRDPIAELISR